MLKLKIFSIFGLWIPKFFPLCLCCAWCIWAEAKGCFGQATEPEAKASGGVVPKQKSQVSQSYSSPQNPYPYLLYVFSFLPVPSHIFVTNSNIYLKKKHS
jgi:hypothetical protein